MLRTFFGVTVPALLLCTLFLWAVSPLIMSGPKIMLLAPLAIIPALLATAILRPDEDEFRKIIKRWEKYEYLYNEAEANDREPVMTIKEISQRTGIEGVTIRDDISQMMAFGQVAQEWYDKEEESLYLPYMTAEEYEKQFYKEDEEDSRTYVDTETHGEEEADGIRPLDLEGYIRKITEIKRRIRSEEMSKKLTVLNNTVAGIKDHVRNYPENNAVVRRLAGYYLPTMIRLISSYAELEKQPIKTGKTEETKKEIEESVDIMTEAFRNVFTQMLEETETDISSDISVMKTKAMLDGLLPEKGGELLQQH